jgi:hypothetical protein
VGLSSTVRAAAIERLGAAACVLLATSALAFLYLFNPSTSTLYPACPFLWFTGCYCPGCGSLRAIHQLTRGHLAVALGLNPLMVLSVPLLGYSLASCAARAITGRPPRPFFIRPVFIWTLLGLVLVYWVLRNVPTYPFSLLAP